MANCPACRERLSPTRNGSFRTCRACKDWIYGKGRSELKCNRCDEYFHEFCVGNHQTVNFRFADSNAPTVLSLVTNAPIEANSQHPRCQACHCRMRGSSRYRGGGYTLHPECAVNLAPLRNINQGNESVLNQFLERHPECAGMVVQLSRVLSSEGLGNCMICGRLPSANNYQGFWYIIGNTRRHGGCHLGCFREQLIKNRPSSEMVNLESYYKSLPRRINNQVAVEVLKFAIGLVVPPPYSDLLVFALSVTAAAVRR